MFCKVGPCNALTPSLAAFFSRNAQGIDAELIGQLVEAALDPVRRVRGAGRAVGGDLGAIADDIVTG